MQRISVFIRVIKLILVLVMTIAAPCAIRAEEASASTKSFKKVKSRKDTANSSPIARSHQGPAGPRGPQGPQGPSGSLASAYISAYTMGSMSLRNPGNIEFTSTQFTPLDISLSSSTVFTVADSGKYLVNWTFHASGTGGASHILTVDLEINGSAILPSPYQMKSFATGTTALVSGSAVIELAAGDQVTLSCDPHNTAVFITNPAITLTKVAP